MLIIYDEQQHKMIEYRSNDHITLGYLAGLDYKKFECYTNEDFDQIKADRYGKQFLRRSNLLGKRPLAMELAESYVLRATAVQPMKELEFAKQLKF